MGVTFNKGVVSILSARKLGPREITRDIVLNPGRAALKDRSGARHHPAMSQAEVSRLRYFWSEVTPKAREMCRADRQAYPTAAAKSRRPEVVAAATACPRALTASSMMDVGVHLMQRRAAARHVRPMVRCGIAQKARLALAKWKSALARPPHLNPDLFRILPQEDMPWRVNLHWHLDIVLKELQSPGLDVIQDKVQMRSTWAMTTKAGFASGGMVP